MISYKVCRITSVLGKESASRVVAALEGVGHYHVHIQDSRNPSFGQQPI